MITYQELLAQRVALDKQIAETREQETAGAIAKVRALIEEFGLTQVDLFGKGKGKGKGSSEKIAGSKVAAKYRDPNTGATWTGRGKAPRWLDGKDRNEFLIA